MKKFFQLGFLPTSADFGLLVVRVWFGALMIMNHGWVKLMGWGEMADKFPDPLGVGHMPSLGLAIFGELVGAALIVLGLFARFGALALGITMGVAFVMVHGAGVSEKAGGEMACVYLGFAVLIFLAGPGKFSFDGAGSGAKQSKVPPAKKKES